MIVRALIIKASTISPSLKEDKPTKGSHLGKTKRRGWLVGWVGR
jgi:hypothetical protein